MIKISFTLRVNHQSDIPKYQQIVNSVNNGIAENILDKGDLLPSVNSIYKNISVISTDFEEMGIRAGEFITEDKRMLCYIPIKLTIRESL